MKYHFTYKTKDNVRHAGVIDAPSREEVFARLKDVGIRPIRVLEAPGLWNKFRGRGKRWLVIALLLCVVIYLSISIWRYRNDASDRDALMMSEPRAQLYGDPVVIEGANAVSWRNVFSDVGDCWFAEHAIPGRQCGCKDRSPADLERISIAISAGCHNFVLIYDSDLQEIAKMKRMVNGMKEELKKYLCDGGSADKYMRRADMRLRVEAGIYDRVRREIQRSRDPLVWHDKNVELRTMGLPLVSPED